MKWLPIIGLLINSCCLGQGVKFQVYLTKSCQTREQLDTTYFLYAKGRYDSSYFPVRGTTALPSPGRYEIHFFPGPVLENNELEIQDSGLYILRYREPRVQLYMRGPVIFLPVYEECGRALNGYKENFYENGHIRLRGNFENGQPRDSLVQFYEGGVVKKRAVYTGNIGLTEEFDSLGRLISRGLSGHHGIAGWVDYQQTRFYPDGKIASEYRLVHRVRWRALYYPSGQLKLKQTEKYRKEYFENGSLRLSYTWTYGKEDSLCGTVRDVRINAKRYDSSGRMVYSAEYEKRGRLFPQPDVSISKSDWILSIKKYVAGREIILAEDMDPKEYLTIHPEERDDIKLESDSR